MLIPLFILALFAIAVYFIKKKLTQMYNQWFIFNLINKINKNIKLDTTNKLNNLEYRLKWLMGKWYNQKRVIDSKNNYLYNINEEYQKKWHRYYTMINSYFKNNKKILFEYGDVNYSIDQPIITKTRPIECNSNILLPLDVNRHWENVLTFKFNDIKFEDKKSICFWRGATTGLEDNNKDILRPGNRIDLIEKWFQKDKKIDVGFSYVNQSNNEYKKYVKGTCDIDTFLNYKYLISVEGNDVASGLKWNLYSNSLVLMPKPRIVSWFMEDHLEPDVHYILIKDDWSDLKEKIEWCEKNQEKCLKIINNANAYVQRFIDEFESGFALEIIEGMVKIYSDNFTFK